MRWTGSRTGNRFVVFGRVALRGLRNDRSAVAAVEFALVLPVMLLLYVGTVDVTRGVMSSRKAGLVSRTLSDLVAQQQTALATPTSTIATIFTAAAAIMQPFPTASLTETVSGVTIQGRPDGTCCDVVVNWSYTQGGTLRSCGSKLTQSAAGAAPSATTFPTSIIAANQQAGYTYSANAVSYAIIADVGYTYQPLMPQAASWFAGGFQKTTYMVPRAQSGTVTLATPVVAAASGQSGCSS